MIADRKEMAMSIQLEQQVEETLKQTKEAFYVNSILTTTQKNDALEVFAKLIEGNANTLIAENQKDLEQAKADNLQGPMLSRLKLDLAKLKQVAQGIRDLIQLEDPAGKILLRTKLDDGLVLEKVSVPLGVIGIIFESRPDVMPQVLSLILKSGNAVVLKGGREAAHSNRAFMALVKELNQKCPFLSPHWASLLDSREAVHSMLNYPEYVDLIIPRGSNQLVSSIMAATKIPVMGHADGICHIYVHHSAHLKNALAIIVDAKIQYPSACNAVETLLVDKEVASVLLPDLSNLATENGILLKGCEATCAILKDCQPATEADWRTE
jgi:glutamate-5-semialdehyde dehydrogenase